MAGLLDLVDDPKAQLGLGLLAAASPRFDNAGFGQRLLEGVNTANAMRRANMDAKLKEAEIQQQQVQLQNQKAWAGMWSDDQSSGQSQSMVQPQTAGDANISATGATVAQRTSTPGGVPLIPGLSYEESRNAALMLGPQGYMKSYIEKAGAQTEFVKNLVSAGIGPKSDIGRQLIQQNIYKTNHIPLTSAHSGSPLVNDRGEVVSMAPHIPTNSIPIIENGQIVGVKPLPGASLVEQVNAAATAAGRSQYEPAVAFDDKGDQYYTNKLVASQSGGLPKLNSNSVQGGTAPMRSNNPGALMPQGKLGQYGSMEEGIAALDSNLKNYGMKGVNTLAGVISKWAPPNENDTQGYIAAVSKRLNLDPNQQINLSNPAVRQAIGTAIMLQENGAGGLFGSPTAQSQKPMRAGAPVGATNNVQLMQGQGSDLLKTAQLDAAANRQTNAYFDEIEHLLDRGARFGPMSADIAKWKAMLPGVDLSGAMTNQDVMRKVAANLAGARGTRSDADLANWQKAYPNGEMTNQAIKEVLPMLRATLAVSDARSKVLTNASSSGLESLPKVANEFNQIASPSLVAAGQQLAQASQSGQTKEFIAKFKAQYPNDWKQRLQDIEKLDRMGAF